MFFFFQAEDGIRDKLVTGVQTCALPICSRTRDGCGGASIRSCSERIVRRVPRGRRGTRRYSPGGRMEWSRTRMAAASFIISPAPWATRRSEEHTSELQSLAYLVCRLLLEKKKKKRQRK